VHVVAQAGVIPNWIKLLRGEVEGLAAEVKIQVYDSDPTVVEAPLVNKDAGA